MATRVRQVRKPDGPPVNEDFAVETIALCESLESGNVLVKTTIISVDPYMRPAMNSWSLIDDPITFGGGAVGTVVESSAKEFIVGDVVVGNWGWTDLAVVPADELRMLGPHALVSPSSALNLYGSNGLTAYMGVEQIMKPEQGEVVYVSGGAGSVGSAVGMMCKRRGCGLLIGSAGSQAKLEYMKSIGYDAVFNYKKESTARALKRLAPKGLDCYFDNVGGKTALDAVLAMNNGGRVAVCGCIHIYNAKSIKESFDNQNIMGIAFKVSSQEKVFAEFALGLSSAYKGPQPWKKIKLSRGRTITWKAFNVREFSKSSEGRAAELQIAQWVAEKSLPSAGREDVVKGNLSDLPRVFQRMLSGKNNGKQVLKL